jgi:uncharacterized protein
MASAQYQSAAQVHALAEPDRPIAPSDRIAAIDMVRGIALFGVVAINVVTEFRVSIFEQFLPARMNEPWFDRLLQSILMVGIDLKALALFSLLFGLGLAIQYDHLCASSRRMTLLVRRLAFLLVIGGFHLVLIWNGDILLEYAIAGFIVLAFLPCAARLVILAGICLLAFFIAAPFLPPLASLPSSSWMAQHIAEAARRYGSGGFTEVLAFRVRELPAIAPLHVFVFPRTVALMLIGVAAWRWGLFRSGSRANSHLPIAAVVGIVVGGSLSVAIANETLQLGWKVKLSLDRLGAVLLACGYGAAIIWASDKPTPQRVIAWAAPVGRMAFTNYLAQSLTFGWIFYGYGLGLFAKLGVAAALAIGIVVYVLQAAFSAFWLLRYNYGPVEWLWRSAMYATWQPFRRLKAF